MASTILAIDDNDASLGAFFQSCLGYLETELANKGINPQILRGQGLNDLSVQLATDNHKKFVFGAYSHGNATCLVKSNNPYISTAVNHTSFANSFFYTFSCSCGITLGGTLIDNGCLCFIGYNKVISIWSTYVDPFIKCANHGLLLFLDGVSTFLVIKNMRDKYNEEIDKIYTKDFLIASILRENRDALVIHGNDISLADITA